MVVTPLKPSDFKTKIPQETKQPGNPHPDTLVVFVNANSTLRLNKETDLGTINEPEKLIRMLSDTFQKRRENGVLSETTQNIQKTVFIKAPRGLPYGEVVKIVDAVKITGAEPISLQIDDLE